MVDILAVLPSVARLTKMCFDQTRNLPNTRCWESLQQQTAHIHTPGFTTYWPFCFDRSADAYHLATNTNQAVISARGPNNQTL